MRENSYSNIRNLIFRLKELKWASAASLILQNGPTTTKPRLIWGNNNCASHNRLSSLPCSSLDGFNELDSEQELDCADEEAAEVERQREGTHRQRHLVQDQQLRGTQVLVFSAGQKRMRMFVYKDVICITHT